MFFKLLRKGKEIGAQKGSIYILELCDKSHQKRKLSGTVDLANASAAACMGVKYFEHRDACQIAGGFTFGNTRSRRGVRVLDRPVQLPFCFSCAPSCLCSSWQVGGACFFSGYKTAV